MLNDHKRNMIQFLLREYGITFAEEAGIVLKNEPEPLFQLLMLSLLLSEPAHAASAVHAVRALRLEGFSTAEKMVEATWQQRLDVLIRHGYERHEEDTATCLGRLGERVLSKYQGDLRKLEQQASGDADRTRKLLQEFDGIDDIGATIFLCEVQRTWPALGPVVDRRVVPVTDELGLTPSNLELSHLVPPDDLPRFLAALVRVRRDNSAGEILRTASTREI